MSVHQFDDLRFFPDRRAGSYSPPNPIEELAFSRCLSLRHALPGISLRSSTTEKYLLSFTLHTQILLVEQATEQEISHEHNVLSFYKRCIYSISVTPSTVASVGVSVSVQLALSRRVCESVYVIALLSGAAIALQSVPQLRPPSVADYGEESACTHARELGRAHA